MSHNEVIFVVNQHEIYRGDDALKRLVVVNDSGFADESGEILWVSDERWRTAQEYERSTWMDDNARARADRNSTHADGFGGYSALPKAVGDILELGCGVFTNLQYVLQGRTARSVTLLDPLVDTFRSHENCTYRDGVLKTQGSETFPATLVSQSIEGWETEARFDVVVMVNVLHHCKDASVVFAKLRTLLKPGGWLVFHEPPREIDPATHYDAGHPLAPHAATIEAFLGLFEPVYHEGWYFIGRMPGAEEAKSDTPARGKPRRSKTAK